VRWAGPAAVFVLALVCFGIVFQSLPVLYDTDSYYHLAIARTYARHGIVDSLPWAQLSLLHEFGDKEVLFHLLLAPVADTADPSAGGRWALALHNAALAAALAVAVSIRRRSRRRCRWKAHRSQSPVPTRWNPGRPSTLRATSSIVRPT
jgi:hypothetical protein